MSDGVFNYLEKKTQEAYEQSNWHDDVGKNFGDVFVPELTEALRKAERAESDLMDIMQQIDNELSKKNTY